MPADKYEAVTKEFFKFRVYEDPLDCTELIWTDTECENGVCWWDMHCGHLPNLSALAVILVSLPSSSGAVERSFSMLDFVHSKLRNKLDPAIREMLLYIYYNLRSLHNDRVRVIGTEEFHTTKSGKMKVVVQQDKGIVDAILADDNFDC